LTGWWATEDRSTPTLKSFQISFWGHVSTSYIWLALLFFIFCFLDSKYSEQIHFQKWINKMSVSHKFVECRDVTPKHEYVLSGWW
jgi:hypothetical protein